MKLAGLAIFALVMMPATAMASAQADLERMMRGGPMLSAKKLKKAVATADAFPLGSAQNPVRAHFPTGQRAYLDRLRCADGSAPVYHRAFNVGVGVFGSIVDEYVVTCGAAAPGEVRVQMDMYHPGHIEIRPVSGFTLAAPGSPKPVAPPADETKS